MTALLEHPTRVRVAAARLCADAFGVDPCQVRLSAVDGPGTTAGALAEVRVDRLFGDTWPLAAFLVHAPTPREPHAFNMEVFVDDEQSFTVGRVGLLIRPGFRDPTVTDYDPFHRQLVTIPPDAHDVAGHPVRQKFLAVYTRLIDYCLSRFDRTYDPFPDVNRRPRLQNALVRLYQARALLNPFCSVLPRSRLSHSPASFRPVGPLSNGRLAGWRSLTPQDLATLLDACLPLTEMPLRLSDETSFFVRLGWLGPRLPYDHPDRADGSWLFHAPPAPIVVPEEQVTVAPLDFEALARSLYDLPITNGSGHEGIRRIMETAEERMFQSLGIPSQIVQATAQEFASYLPTRTSRMVDAGLIGEARHDQTPPPPPQPRKTEITVEDVPETLFEVTIDLLTRALAGRADDFPNTEFLVFSDTGRTVKLEPTAPPPAVDRSEAKAGRGLLLD